MSLKGKTAIVGLGMTELGKVFGRDSNNLAAEATKLAVEDAGLRKEDIDGLITCTGVAMAREPMGGLGVSFQNYLGLRDLRLVNHMSVFGSTPGQMVQFAAMAIDAGMCNTVACVFADTPLREKKSSGGAFSFGTMMMPGVLGLIPAYGLTLYGPHP